MTAFEPPVGPPGGPPVADATPTITDASRRTAEDRPSPVAAALARLDGVHRLPLHEQPDVYQAVHTELQNALAAIDDA